jgi:hypothetical protein
LYESYSLYHPSCHYLRSEHVEVEGMNIVEEQDHPMNHQLGKERMNMAGSHKVEVEGMDTVEEHFHLINYQPEVEDMYMVDSDMGENRTVEL